MLTSNFVNAIYLRRMGSIFSRLEVVETALSYRLLKNAQMQVELCEIPLAGARKIPRNAGQMGVFQQPGQNL